MNNEQGIELRSACVSMHLAAALSQCTKKQMVAKSHERAHTHTHPEGLQINQQDFRCRLTVLPGISQSHASLNPTG